MERENVYSAKKREIFHRNKYKNIIKETENNFIGFEKENFRVKRKIFE